MDRKTVFRKVKEYAEAIITALILALIIRAYVVQAFKIPSGSMIPTLLVGDHILVSKFIYGTRIPFSERTILPVREPRKGDIIVFKYPKDPKRDFIKRVIGTPGDVIEGRNKEIYLNGEKLTEPYVRHTDSVMLLDQRDTFGPIKVPDGKVFVMGDNRDASLDSRFWGFVDKSQILGKAFIIYWSWNSDKYLPRVSRIGDIIK
ncbi:MAG: signal peptidase I [Thermodesulfovibrionales bacterium]